MCALGQVSFRPDVCVGGHAYSSSVEVQQVSCLRPTASVVDECTDAVAVCLSQFEWVLLAQVHEVAPGQPHHHTPVARGDACLVACIFCSMLHVGVV